MQGCIFCGKPETEIIAENKLALAFFDKYPVNKGHVLVVPKRHVETFFDANWQEIMDINKLIFEVKDILQIRFNPAGFNIGVNVGRSAGQTIFHLHYHIIPRYEGDVEDPRGGIRRIKKSIVPYLEEGELPNNFFKRY
ncbi:HIT family protein [Desulfoscipio gibsoniae]